MKSLDKISFRLWLTPLIQVYRERAISKAERWENRQIDEKKIVACDDPKRLAPVKRNVTLCMGASGKVS